MTPASSSALTRRQHGEDERPTCSARSALLSPAVLLQAVEDAPVYGIEGDHCSNFLLLAQFYPIQSRKGSKRKDFPPRQAYPVPMTTLAPVQRLRLLRELERKVLWLSAWTIHHANHLRPNRDGLKVGGHQASCASIATVMTALYFSVLRPEDRVAVKPHACAGVPRHPIPVRPSDAGQARAVPRPGRRAVLSVAHQGRRRRRFLDRLGRPRRGHDALLLAGAGLCAPEGAGRRQAADRPHGGAGRRRRARRGQHLRGAARGLEARRPQPLVGHRLQSPEPRRRGHRPPVRPHRRDVRDWSAGASSP